ncbi:MAG: hypothetical protein M1405_00365 [Patescibacteria group bacterium]|nr:hypothetical protein [Patescibacteria group bacterium]
MRARCELPSDPALLESIQICHERGRGRVYTAGLDPEVFADRQILGHERHTNGAVEAQRQDLDYHGGSSTVDIVDSLDL